MSSLSYEECAHKMLKLNIRDGQEVRARGPRALRRDVTRFRDAAVAAVSMRCVR